MIAALSADELWVVTTCALCAVACAVPGVFLMLNRASLLGDAISHSVLPGIAIAFLVSGTRAPLPMLLGALIAGLLTAATASLLSRGPLIKQDAALGMTYTAFFSLGVIIISIIARQVDLDPGCVLYGLAEYVAFDTVTIFSYEIPKAFVWTSSVLLAHITLLLVFWKEIVISVFDPALAHALGLHPNRVRYGILTCVTVTIVTSFETLGSVLVVSMLIAPAATAYLLSDRLTRVVALAALVAVCAAVPGYFGALYLNTSVAGMLSVAAGSLFVLAAVCAPHHGLLVRVINRTSLRYRILRDDILGLLYRWHEVTATRPSAPVSRHDISRALHSRLLSPLALRSLSTSGEISIDRSGGLRLTEKGMREASALIRSHRLWESYLAKHLGLSPSQVHEPSERAEHFIGPALAQEIAEDIDTRHDPHGRRIP